MSAGSLIFLLLIAGSVFAMFSMHRGGHAHGGMGGCGGGHNHGGGDREEEPADTHAGHEGHETKPLLGPPGTRSGEPASAPAQGHRHRGC